MKSTLSYLCVSGICILTAIASSCSTTRMLSGDQKRLTKNLIEVKGDKNFNTGALAPFLKQRHQNWTPSLCVYNWQNGKGKGWDKFVTKLGTAPVIFDSTLVDDSKSNLRQHLEYIGYYNSTVNSEVITKKRKVKVKYTVGLGKRYRIRDIKYIVPGDSLFNASYFADTVNSIILRNDYLSEANLEAETARAATALRDKGYYDFNKNYFFFEADTLSDRSEANLKISIKNHTRNEKPENDIRFEKYKIGKVAIHYPKDLKFRDKILLDLNTLHPGDMYSERRVSMNYSRLNTIPLFNSIGVQLSPDTTRRLVNCDINLQKGKIQGFKIGLEASVNATGLFGISPEISYYHRNIFHGGEILTLSVSTNHQMKFSNASAHANEVSVNGSLTFPKFIPFSTKGFRGSNLPKTIINASFNYQNRPEYIRTRISASFGYQGKILRHFQYQFNPLALDMISIPFLDDAFAAKIKQSAFLQNSFEDHFDLGANGILYYSSSLESNPKESYWYSRLRVDASGNILGLFSKSMAKNEKNKSLIFGVPFYQYVRGELSIGRTFVWGKNSGQSLAMRFLAGASYLYGNSTALPLEKQFYSGGANSLRGWTARCIGPGTSPVYTTWTIPNQTGDMKLEANIEYRFKIFWKICGALFVDAGNVWNIYFKHIYDPYYGSFDNVPEPQKGSFFDIRNFANSIGADWGAGLRFDLSFIVLRVDFGMRFHDPARTGSKWVGPDRWLKDGNYAFHFGVGYPF